MSLKLFRSTGYSSILSPGETRQAMHPGWLVVAASLWAGFACNVSLWRALAVPGPGLAHALAMGAFIAGASAAMLSLLGWRKTLKSAATLVLLLAALSACGAWGQPLHVEGDAQLRLSSFVLPTWASLMRWQASALLAALAVVPIIWVWSTPIRRLPGPRQLSSNVMGMLAGAAVMAVTGFALLRGVF